MCKYNIEYSYRSHCKYEKSVVISFNLKKVIIIIISQLAEYQCSNVEFSLKSFHSGKIAMAILGAEK